MFGKVLGRVAVTEIEKFVVEKSDFGMWITFTCRFFSHGQAFAGFRCKNRGNCQKMKDFGENDVVFCGKK